MPKINTTSIKTFPNCDTLRIFKYENSQNYHVSFYAGPNYAKNCMFQKTLKTKNYKDATLKAKELWKSFDKKTVTKRDISFDDDIAKPFFISRLKKYDAKGKPDYAKKEKNMYLNFIKPFFEDIDYRNQDALETAVEEVVYELKKKNIKDTTISKYINLLSLMFQKGFKSRKIDIMPDLPTMKRINEERPMYYPRELKQITNNFEKNDDPFPQETSDYINFCRSCGVRPGLEPLRIKRFQTRLISVANSLPILKIYLQTKTKQKHFLPVHPSFTEEVYFPRMMTRYPDATAEDYLFFPEEKNREKLYERIRKNFSRVSRELGLYYLNDKERPLYSIRHTFITNRHHKGISIDVIADASSTSAKVIKSNYLEHDDKTFIKQERELFKDYYDKKSPAKVLQKY